MRPATVHVARSTIDTSFDGPFAGYTVFRKAKWPTLHQMGAVERRLELGNVLGPSRQSKAKEMAPARSSSALSFVGWIAAGREDCLTRCHEPQSRDGIDHRKAVIVSASTDRVTAKTLESDVGSHARYSGPQDGEGEKKYEERPGQHLDRYYDEVISQQRRSEPDMTNVNATEYD